MQKAWRLHARRQLLDLALRRVEALAADCVERFAALPERDGLVDGDVARLEPLDDLPQLGLCLLERQVARHGCASSTRPAKPPSASSTSTRSSIESAAAERTTTSSLRTMA